MLAPRDACGSFPLADMTHEQNPEKPEPELRLRSQPVERPFHVVLVEPEIPPNTGNVARLCAATRAPLHLVGKLGFRIDEHAVRRAGLDYWHLVDVKTHETLADAERAIDAERPFGRVPRRYFFSGHATRSYLDVKFELGDVLIFGKESVGLPDQLLQERAGEVVGIPMSGLVRSHNLANSVAIALYEALRQTGVLDVTLRGA
ncbi:MAG: tRNA (cytidine(34)-2'-O)-methyltransferase [Myxococcales bacterium]